MDRNAKPKERSACPASTPLPPLPCPVTRIGQMVRGAGLRLTDRDGDVPLPASLGWEH